MVTPTACQQAHSFASRLDADDFEAVMPLLALDCQYDTESETLVGPEAIVESYRRNSEWGRAALDSVVYESRVVEAGERSATLLFIDHILHGGLRHTYRSLQHLTFGPEMIITRIQSAEIPGERQRLTEFFQRTGVER